MRTSEMIKSKFFGARDFQGPPLPVLKIAHVTEELFSRGRTPEVQYFLWFENHQKGLKLNKTRVTALEKAYGPDSDMWTGRRVKLTFDPSVKFGNVEMGSIVVNTEPGAVYTASAGLPGWGGASPPQAPAGAPPAPVWDGQRWVTVNAAPPPAAALTPPPPVWNAQIGQWEMVNPATGEIAVPKPAPRPSPQDGTWGGAPTVSQRVATPSPADDWGRSENPAPAGADADFNDEIPF